ncbi:MAG TPA: hypothetical protein VNZ64_05975 [Candidatus Acidoferrum sp.]|jgi:hypothetical protein|nr:hypothetical protein [Candidatus Acidoferrum sp.]
MREIRPSGSEGGVAHLRHPYPYPSLHRCAVHAGVRFSSSVSGGWLSPLMVIAKLLSCK